MAVRFPGGCRRIAAVALLAILGPAAAWLGRHEFTSPPRATAPVRGAIVLRRGNGPEPESLDIHRARSEGALTLLRDLYEGLTAVSPDGTPVLAAADRCDVSPDGRTYRFHLREDARWSNGETLDAADFVAAWRRLVDPHTGAQYADILAPVAGAAAIIRGSAAPESLAVRGEGPRVLVVELEHPTPYFLDLLSHPATFPINRTALAAHGARYAKPGSLVSNGAFALSRWDFGSHLVATRNARYWNDGHTRIDAVEYYSFADPATELKAFRTGELDSTTTLPAAQFRWVAAHMSPLLHVAPQLAVYYLGLNLRRPPLGDSPPLRRALAMVIDRDRLVQAVTGSGEAPAYGIVPPQTRDYSSPQPRYASQPMAERIAAARRLLADAGMDRQPPRLELRYNSSELHGRIAVAVAGMWKEALGIDTRLVAEEFKILLQDIDRGDVVQVFRASWVGDYDDAYGFLQLFESGFGINLPRYASPAYDALLARAVEEGDAGRRRELLQRAEAILLDDQPVIPLYFYVSKHLVASRVEGWHDNPLNVVYSKDLSVASETSAQ